MTKAEAFRRALGPTTDDSHITRLDSGAVSVRANAEDVPRQHMGYRELNEVVRRLIAAGEKHIVLEGVVGQRYIASTASAKDLYIEIHGTPGNDLGAFLDGPTIEVFGNAQDQTGNTMNAGRIIVHGNAWDVTGFAARGGTILIKGNTGYRVGIHMKEYCGVHPTLVIGGTAKDYLGEYMAGGTIVILNLNAAISRSPVGLNVGAGIHGGKMLIRGRVQKHQLGPGASTASLSQADIEELEPIVKEFEKAFAVEAPRAYERWTKVVPTSSRPFSGHYDPTCV
ncbi:MAG TPA: hypothetical protein VEH08_06280 [Methanomassiliicoccales archaeon]|nr:hypothetical protein [Methanomassiliicoccales archaeon]